MVHIKEGDKVRSANYVDPEKTPVDAQLAWEDLNFYGSSGVRDTARQLDRYVTAVKKHKARELELDDVLSFPKRVDHYLSRERQLDQLVKRGGIKGRFARVQIRKHRAKGRPSVVRSRDPGIVKIAQQRGILSHEGLMTSKDQPPITAPIRVFDTRAFDVEQAEFISAFSLEFAKLPFDTHDVRAAWIRALQEKILPGENWTQKFKNFYYQKAELDSLGVLVGRLTDEQRSSLESLKPWRKRGIASANVIYENDGRISIERLTAENFVQGTGDDLRSWPRNFHQISSQVFDSDAMLKMHAHLLDLTASVKTGVRGIKVTSHFMGVIARVGQDGNNAPEGPHKDGCFAIISAAVVKRYNIKGGESIVYRAPMGATAADLKPEYEVCRAGIQPGQFLYQADESAPETYGENLWHYVTPMEVEDPSKGDGYRYIVGYDVELLY